jgi:hypothetical protein
MEPSEVTRIRRADDSADIVVEPILESLKGMRADQILTSSAFDLETTRDRETTKMMEQYSELLGRTHRDEAEETQFALLAAALKSRVPTFPETPVAREALGLLEGAILGQLEDRPEDERQRILEQADRYMAEIVSRSDPS